MLNLPENSELQKFAAGLVRSGTFESVSLAIEGPRGGAWGAAGGATAGSLFDLASLSKPFLTTLALWLCDRGDLALDEMVFPGRLEQAVSLEALLRHQGGAIAWWPFYHHGASAGLRASMTDQDPEQHLTVVREQHLRRLLASERWGHPIGVYSDVGYMTAARWIEHRLGRPLEVLFRQCWLDLLPQASASEELLVSGRVAVEDARMLGCGLDTTKEVELAAALEFPIEPLGSAPPGLPQDGNARWMASELGLYGGHTGLFGSVGAVFEMGRIWLAGANNSGDAMTRTRHQRESDTSGSFGAQIRRALQPDQGRLMGWFRHDATFGSFSAESFGHTGFVGGGLWIDPRRRVLAVMVGYRLDPMSDLTSQRVRFCDLGGRFSDAAADRLSMLVE